MIAACKRDQAEIPEWDVTAKSPGCEVSPGYPLGTTEATIDAGGERSFRVHVPPGYDSQRPTPVVMMFHGGGGSGEQFQLRSSKMDPIADREGFITVYPDGTGTIHSWNAGDCCGNAQRREADDVGFVAQLIDHLSQKLCVDRRRVFASGMSNGGMLSHRLACELSDRIAAVAPVASAMVFPACAPTRPIPLLQIHGTADGHVPWEGGEGCGISGVTMPSIDDTLSGWRARNGCAESSSETFAEGDTRCAVYTGCAAPVELCTIEGGGHSWPGGEASPKVVDCPGDGHQSTFAASEAAWRFFRANPLPE